MNRVSTNETIKQQQLNNKQLNNNTMGLIKAITGSIGGT